MTSPASTGTRLANVHLTFLARFVARGWLHAVRDDADEQRAVDYGLRKRWLRREMSEVHFTPAGRRAIAEGGPSDV